jgi:MFS transporter, OCT family, solute carrier family 22 (organic cation transporter), member 4/5
MSLMGIGQALASNYERFLFFTFLNGVGISGVYPLAFILGLEMVGKGKREMAGVVLNYFYSLGEALVGVVAWLNGDWVKLQYWVSAPPILFVAYYWIIPESARWLLASKKNRKAYKIIQKAAKNNGTILPQNIVDRFREELQAEQQELYNVSLKIPSENKRSAAFVELIKSKILLTRCLLLFFIW